MRVRNVRDLDTLGIGGQHKQAIKKALSQTAPASRRLSSITEAGGGLAEKTTASMTPAIKDKQDEGSVPQRHLWALVTSDDDIGDLGWVSDFSGAVPKRKFELDIALPDLRCAIEVDGYAFHGKYKKDFLRDRDKDYLLSLQGWQLLRVQAGLIYKEPNKALERVKKFLDIWLPRQRAIKEAGLWLSRD